MTDILPEQPTTELNLAAERWRMRGFVPLNPSDHVQDLWDEEARLRKHVAARGHGWTSNRGVDMLLNEGGGDYAALPPEVYGVLANLVSGEVADFGCGEAVFLLQLAQKWYGQQDERFSDDYLESRQKIISLLPPDITTRLKTLVGLDILPHSNERLAGLYGADKLTGTHNGVDLKFVESGIYADLRTEIGFEVALGFSTALAYHLDDVWLAIRLMSDAVKRNGALAVTALARLVDLEHRDPRKPPTSLETSTGHWVGNPAPLFDREYGLVTAGYFAYKNSPMQIVDKDQYILAPAELIDLINQHNQGHFHLEYSVAKSDKPGVEGMGGRVFGRKLSDTGLRLDFMFYGVAPSHRRYEQHKQVIIVARTDQEKEDLIKAGFESIEDAVGVVKQK